MLREGTYHTLEEIADAEDINPSYVSRVLRMTLLAPELVEAIMAGRQPEGLTMARTMKPFPIAWESQTEIFAVRFQEVELNVPTPSCLKQTK